MVKMSLDDTQDELLRRQERKIREKGVKERNKIIIINAEESVPLHSQWQVNEITFSQLLIFF